MTAFHGNVGLVDRKQNSVLVDTGNDDIFEQCVRGSQARRIPEAQAIVQPMPPCFHGFRIDAFAAPLEILLEEGVQGRGLAGSRCAGHHDVDNGAKMLDFVGQFPGSVFAEASGSCPCRRLHEMGFSQPQDQPVALPPQGQISKRDDNCPELSVNVYR